MSAFAVPITDAMFDRDGTLTVSPPPGQYILQPKRLSLLPGAAEAVARFNQAGVRTHLVTNQRCVARGVVSDDMLGHIHERLQQLLLEQAGAWLDSINACTHERGTCACRKPLPGLLYNALGGPGADFSSAVVLGDRESDIAAGQAVGARTVLLATPGTSSSADIVAPDLLTATEWCLGN